MFRLVSISLLLIAWIALVAHIQQRRERETLSERNEWYWEEFAVTTPHA